MLASKREEVCMDPTDIGLFRLAERRLAWVDERQRVLAQNVANANTPGYVPGDVPSFAASLGQAGTGMARTNPAHLSGGSDPVGSFRRRSQHSADGNAVSLEHELAKVAETGATQELVLNLYHKYQGLFRTALGRTG
jgi:flagellar basal-body rod protein FlgB